MCHFKTDIGAAGTNVPIREKAHSGVSPAGAAKNAAQGISLKVLLMQDFQTAASVLSHRLPHSAKPHPRILPQRGIYMSKADLIFENDTDMSFSNRSIGAVAPAAAFGKTASAVLPQQRGIT